MYVCMCVCMYVCTCVCMCVCIYIYIMFLFLFLLRRKVTSPSQAVLQHLQLKTCYQVYAAMHLCFGKAPWASSPGVKQFENRGCRKTAFAAPSFCGNKRYLTFGSGEKFGHRRVKSHNSFQPNTSRSTSSCSARLKVNRLSLPGFSTGT